MRKYDSEGHSGTFCDFFFAGPGDSLSGVLLQRRCVGCNQNSTNVCLRQVRALASFDVHLLLLRLADRQTQTCEVAVLNAGQSRGHAAGELVVGKPPTGQGIGQVIQPRRNGAAQQVFGEIQISQVVQVSELRRYDSSQLIAMEPHEQESVQVAKRVRYRTFQLVTM